MSAVQTRFSSQAKGTTCTSLPFLLEVFAAAAGMYGTCDVGKFAMGDCAGYC